MRLFKVRNVHAALPVVLAEIFRDGVERDSRNGPVIMFKDPVCVEYAEPPERVLFWPQRDANPWFHFFESLHMIQGNNDVAFLAQFVKSIAQYSNDSDTFYGAYGYRWRNQFGKDQLDYVIEALKKNPNDRRQVLQMWDATLDLGFEDSKDLPCNLTITVQINTSGALDIVVLNRSNDIIFGQLGANAVHFSFLQEFLASSIGVPVGTYYQVSANAHVYKNELLEKCRPIALAEPDPLRVTNSENPYRCFDPYPLMLNTTRDIWENDLFEFFQARLNGEYETLFFNDVVIPMYRAHRLYKENTGADRYLEAIDELEKVAAVDWRTACHEWLLRRAQQENAKIKSQKEGVL